MNTPYLKCIQTGLTHGSQTVARAELIALTEACQHAVDSPSCCSAEFIVDAQCIYIYNQCDKSGANGKNPWHKVKNCDVMQKLWSLWKQKDFIVTKIKSHQQLHMAKNNMDKWNILGNHFADCAAGLALQRVPQEIKTLVSCIAAKLELHKENLQVVYRYICALNRARSDATARGETLNHRDNTVHSPDQAMGDRAKQFMIEYSLTDSFNLVEGAITLEQVNANIQGARLACCVWEWAKTLQWPKKTLWRLGAWGITWFELMINFIIVSGEFPPIKSTGHGSSAIFVPHKSSEGAMQLSSRRMASHLCLAFQNLVQCVQSLSGVKIIPANPRKKSASMLRLGFEGKILTSFPIRPVMQKAHETMTYVYQYIVQLNGAKILKLPLDNLVVDGILDIPHWEYETNAATRYRNYLKLRRIRKKHDD